MHIVVNHNKTLEKLRVSPAITCRQNISTSRNRYEVIPSPIASTVITAFLYQIVSFNLENLAQFLTILQSLWVL